MKQTTFFTIFGVIVGSIPIILISLIVGLEIDESVGIENVGDLHDCYGLLTDEQVKLSHSYEHNWNGFEYSFTEMKCERFYEIDKSKKWIEYQTNKITWNDRR